LYLCIKVLLGDERVSKAGRAPATTNVKLGALTGFNRWKEQKLKFANIASRFIGRASN
jgi:hypothetical protein